METFPQIHLEDLDIIKEIGEGGYGKVYLIKQEENDRTYVAKVSKEAINLDDIDSSPFMKELKSFSRLNNPAIIKLFGYSLKDFNGDPYPTLITDFMPNGSLQSMLEQERRSLAPHNFTSTKKYIILIGVALGMKYLHYKKVVHRDLKPGNILLDENLYPKICDFGCASISEKNIYDQIMKSEEGTASYMAPEIFSDEYFTYKIDIFSFSLIVYEMVTEKKPFKEYKFAFNVIEDIINGKRPDITKCNDYIQSFLSKCWSDNPLIRPTFGEIADFLMQKEFKDSFGILDEDEIDIYLDMFDEDLKNPKLMDCINTQNECSKIEFMQAEDKFIEGGEFLTIKQKLDFFKIAGSTTKDPCLIITHAVELNINGVNEDKIESAKILKKYSDEGNVVAMHHYAEALRYGYGVPVNKEKAAKLMKFAANKGDRLSMEKYADMLHEGIGVPVNPKEAIKYVKMAADKGQRNSLYKYGTSLIIGYGVDVDIEKGAEYLKKAASKGSLEAMVYLSNLIDTGMLKNANFEDAYKYSKQAAEMGCKEGEFKYGLMLKTGIGCAKNLKESAKYIKSAAEKGLPRAMLFHAYNLLDGIVIDQDKLEASKFLKKASDLGIYEAIEKYAYMQYKGDGVLINKKEAAKYYKMAADKGSINSSLFYGWMLCTGNGIDMNKQGAAKYLKIPADKGCNEAMFLYGLCLLDGNGIETNRNIAKHYFEMSAYNGNINSLIMIKYVLV